MSNLKVYFKHQLNKTNAHCFFSLILSHPSKGYTEKCVPSLHLDLILTNELQTTKSSQGEFSGYVKSTSNILKIKICSSVNTNQSGKNLKHNVALRANSCSCSLSFPTHAVCITSSITEMA